MCKTKERSKRIYKIAPWCFLLFILTLGGPLYVHSETNPINITGSFFQNNFHLTPGSQMDAADAFVELQNNLNETMTVSMTSTVQDGLALVYPQSPITLSANSKTRIPLGIIVDKTMVAGEYPIALTLTASSSSFKETSKTLSSIVVISSEFTEMTIRVLSLDQRPVDAMLHLSQMVAGKPIGIRSIQTSSLTERMITGDYRLLVDAHGHQMIYFFSVDGHNKTQDVIFKTMVIPDITVTAQLDPKTKKPAAFDLEYTLDNFQSVKNNLKIELSIYDNETLVDLIDVEYLPTLPIGTQKKTYHYIPDQSLDGKMTFKLSVSDQTGTIWVNQTSSVLDLRDKTWMYLMYLFGFALIISGTGGGLLFAVQQYRKRQTLPSKARSATLLTSIYSAKNMAPDPQQEQIETLKNQNPITLKPSFDAAAYRNLMDEVSVFGAGFILTGDLFTESNLIVKGKVIGNVISTQNVIIEEGAWIEGNVTAENIRILGFVQGAITARQDLSIEQSAKIGGSIKTPSLSISKGADLDCQIIMSSTNNPQV